MSRTDATFVLFSYNQESFIREAVRSVLDQQDVRLSILITDDCSTDRTYEILQTEVSNYDGLHEVHLRQNQKNLGVVPHINKAVSLVRTDIAIVGAGDDVSLPFRARKTLDAFERDDPLLVHSRASMIDAEGDDLNECYGTPGNAALRAKTTARRIARRQSNHLGATAAWHLDLFRKFGPIRFDSASEDAVLEFRAALENRLSFVDEVLVKYRVDEDRMKFRPLHELPSAVALSRRLAAIRVNEAVYLQRLSDLDSAHERVDPRLRPILDRAVARLRCCQDIHESGVGTAVWRHRRHPFIALSAVLKELNFLRKIR